MVVPEVRILPGCTTQLRIARGTPHDPDHNHRHRSGARPDRGSHYAVPPDTRRPRRARPGLSAGARCVRGCAARRPDQRCALAAALQRRSRCAWKITEPQQPAVGNHRRPSSRLSRTFRKDRGARQSLGAFGGVAHRAVVTGILAHRTARGFCQRAAGRSRSRVDWSTHLRCVPDGRGKPDDQQGPREVDCGGPAAR